MSQQLAVSILYKWFKENAESFKNKNAEMEFRDSGQGSAYVRVDTVDYMSELIVWDKNFHLDEEIIDRDTDESMQLKLHKYETQAEFEQHLADFIKWFDSVNNTTNDDDSDYK